MHGEGERVKERTILGVERAVDKDAFGVGATPRHGESAHLMLRGAPGADSIPRSRGDLGPTHRRCTNGILDYSMLEGVTVFRGNSTMPARNRQLHAVTQARNRAPGDTDLFNLSAIRRGRRGSFSGLFELPAARRPGLENSLFGHLLPPSCVGLPRGRHCGTCDPTA